MIKWLIPLFIFFGCSNVDINKYKKDNEYSLLKGINLYSQGKNREALIEYEKALEKDPKNILILREIAIIKSQLLEYKESKNIFLEILKKEPRDIESLRNLSYLFFDEKNYKKSIFYLEKVPKDLKTQKDYAILAFSYYKIGESKRALLTYKKLKESIVFNSIILTKSYIKVLSENGNKENLFLILKSLEKYKPEDVNNVILISNTYENELQNYKYAEKVLKDFLSSNKINDKILLQLAKLYYKIGKKKECRIVFSMISEDYQYNLEYIKVKTYMY